MADISDLKMHINSMLAEITSIVPREIAQDMHRQTMRNFEQEAYTNNGGSDPWPDRPYENELGYKKLDYTGKLKGSIRTMKAKLGKRSATAGVGTSVRYAQAHNEGGFTNPYSLRENKNAGLRTLTSGRKVNIAASEVKKRQFMGIGSETIFEAKREINNILGKYFSRF